MDEDASITISQPYGDAELNVMYGMQVLIKNAKLTQVGRERVAVWFQSRINEQGEM